MITSYETCYRTLYLDAMLQTIQLPTGIAHLDTSLTNMDGDTFTLRKKQHRIFRERMTFYELETDTLNLKIKQKSLINGISCSGCKHSKNATNYCLSTGPSSFN